VRLFSEEGTERRVIKHTGWVNAVTFSPDGRLLATGSGIGGITDEPLSGFVRVFHTDDGNEVLSEIYKYKSRVLQVAFNQSGRYLASVADDGTARLTCVDDGTSEPILDPGVGVRKIAFSPDGALLAAIRVDGSVWIRILETKEKYRLFFKPNAEISALAFGPANSLAGTPLIAIGTQEKGSCPGSCSASFTRIMKAAKAGGEVHSIPQGETLVNVLAFSSDGFWLASAGNDSAVKILNLRKVFAGSPKALFELALPGRISALAFSPDSQLLAAGSVDGSTRLVAVVDSRVVALIDNGSGDRETKIEPGSKVNDLKFSPNGRFLGIAGEFPRAQLIPLIRNEPVGARVEHAVGLGEEIFLLHDYGVRAVAFSADSRFFASGGQDGVARLVALDKPTKATPISAPSGISTLAFGPESMLFVGGEDGVVTFQPDRAGKPIPFHPHPSIVVPNNVVAMTFSSDYTLFALGSLDGTVQLMTVDGWQPVKQWPKDRASPSGLAKSRGGESLGGLAFGGANRFFAGGIGFYQGKGAVRIWDIGRRTVLPEIATDSWVKAVAFSPDGGLFATVEENGHVRIHWLADRRPPKDLPFQADSSVAFSPTGRFMATAGSDGTVRILTTGGQVFASVQHPEGVAMMAFSANGRMLATASYADVRLLEVPSGRELARVTHSAKITALAFSPNSRFLATGGGTDPFQSHKSPRTPHPDDRSARVWNTDLGAIFERLCRGQGRNLGLAEWRRQFGDLPWQPTCKAWPIPADVKPEGLRPDAEARR